MSCILSLKGLYSPTVGSCLTVLVSNCPHFIFPKQKQGGVQGGTEPLPELQGVFGGVQPPPVAPDGKKSLWGDN